MRRCFSLIAAALLLGAALAPSPALASPPRARAASLGSLLALDTAWEPLARLWRSIVGLRPDNGCSPDPNGCAALARGRSLGGRPQPGVRPDEGAGPDPNGR
jgi:hypothetical protein